MIDSFSICSVLGVGTLYLPSVEPDHIHSVRSGSALFACIVYVQSLNVVESYYSTIQNLEMDSSS